MLMERNGTEVGEILNWCFKYTNNLKVFYSLKPKLTRLEGVIVKFEEVLGSGQSVRRNDPVNELVACECIRGCHVPPTENFIFWLIRP